MNARDALTTDQRSKLYDQSFNCHLNYRLNKKAYPAFSGREVDRRDDRISSLMHLNKFKLLLNTSGYFASEWELETVIENCCRLIQNEIQYLGEVESPIWQELEREIWSVLNKEFSDFEEPDFSEEFDGEVDIPLEGLAGQRKAEEVLTTVPELGHGAPATMSDFSIVWATFCSQLNTKDIESRFTKNLVGRAKVYARRRRDLGLLDDRDLLTEQKYYELFPKGLPFRYVVEVTCETGSDLKLYQPNIFSDGFAELYVTEKTNSSLGGRARKLSLKNCPTHGINSCDCGGQGNPEVVLPMSGLSNVDWGVNDGGFLFNKFMKEYQAPEIAYLKTKCRAERMG